MISTKSEITTNNTSSGMDITIKNDNSNLVISIYDIDGSPQITVGYNDDDDDFHDVAVFEIKKNKLAKTYGLCSNNKLIDLYLYTDDDDDDYTHKFVFNPINSNEISKQIDAND